MLDTGSPVGCEQYQIDLLLRRIFDQLRDRRSEHHLSEDLGGISAIVFLDARKFLFGFLHHQGLAPARAFCRVTRNEALLRARYATRRRHPSPAPSHRVTLPSSIPKSRLARGFSLHFES